MGDGLALGDSRGKPQKMRPSLTRRAPGQAGNYQGADDFAGGKVMPKLFLLRLLVLVPLVFFLVSGCNLPPATRPATDSVFTQAAQTVQAQLTLESLLTPPDATPEPSVFETATPELPTATLPATSAPSATPLCDLARFMADVTIPDGTEILPGQTFTKTWRLRNMGTCTWTSGYQLIFDSGSIMDGPISQPLAGDVPPGQEVDLSVALKAPDNPGTYRGYWRIRNAAGVLLPILNGYQGTSFFVEIKVVAPTFTPTLTLTPSLTPTVTPTPSETP
jgi:hypothetical protein